MYTSLYMYVKICLIPIHKSFLFKRCVEYNRLSAYLRRWENKYYIITVRVHFIRPEYLKRQSWNATSVKQFVIERSRMGKNLQKWTEFLFGGGGGGTQIAHRTWSNLWHVDKCVNGDRQGQADKKKSYLTRSIDWSV